MKSYILISTVERESTVQAFASIESAKDAMYNEFIDLLSAHIDDEDLSEIVSEIEYDGDYISDEFAFYPESAWYNDHYGQNLDWVIQEIDIPTPDDDSIATIHWVKDDILATLKDEAIPFDEEFLDDCCDEVYCSRYFKEAQIETGLNVISTIIQEQYEKLSQDDKDNIIRKMGEALKSIPMNEEDELEEDFYWFEAGTCREEILDFFELNSSEGVLGDILHGVVDRSELKVQIYLFRNKPSAENRETHEKEQETSLLYFTLSQVPEVLVELAERRYENGWYSVWDGNKHIGTERCGTLLPEFTQKKKPDLNSKKRIHVYFFEDELSGVHTLFRIIHERECDSMYSYPNMIDFLKDFNNLLEENRGNWYSVWEGDDRVHWGLINTCDFAKERKEVQA